MTKAQHTPQYFRTLQSLERESGPFSLTADEMGALRRLEHSAPDMLEALEAALEEIKAWRDGRNTRNMNTCKVGARFSDIGVARAALAKARGEG